MLETTQPGKLRTMLDSKLTVGQVLSGAFTTIVTVVGLVTYVHTTFETKADSALSNAKFEKRIEKTEDAIAQQTKVQSDIAAGVAYIKGRLEPAIGK